MKTKNTLKEIAQASSIVFGAIALVAIFGSLGQCSVDKHNKSVQTVTATKTDNKQLNEIEQYHQSKQRNIIFVEEITYK